MAFDSALPEARRTLPGQLVFLVVAALVLLVVLWASGGFGWSAAGAGTTPAPTASAGR